LPSIEFDDDRPPRSRDELLEHVRGQGRRRRYGRRAAVGGVAALLLAALVVPTLGGDDPRRQLTADGGRDRDRTESTAVDENVDYAGETTTTTGDAGTGATTTTRRSSSGSSSGVAPTTTVTPFKTPKGGASDVIIFEGISGGERGIFSVRGDGSGHRQLTPEGGWFYYGARWSPDGTRIAAIEYVTGVEPKLQVMDADGGHLHYVDDPAGMSWGEDWSPDGTQLVYQARNAQNENELRIANADGTGRRVLGPALDDGGFADWSPDGGLIAYTQAAGICTIKPDGTGQKVFLPGAHSPVWSPDGSKLLFVKDTNPTDGDPPTSVWVVNRDGSGLIKLADSSATPSASWSPDGSRIAISGDWLVVTDVLGTNRRTLHNETTWDASWSADGSRLAFVQSINTSSQLMTIAADGSDLGQISPADPVRRPTYRPR
jgi:Tol biopolymer transport system component